MQERAAQEDESAIVVLALTLAASIERAEREFDGGRVLSPVTGIVAT
jgi:hypothetical protein